MREHEAARKAVNPATWWALVGALLLALQLWVYTRWIASGDARPTVPSGPDVPSDWEMANVVGIQIAGPILFTGAAAWLVRQCLREKRITFDAACFLAWMMKYWLDPGGQLFRLHYLYNSYLFNYGSWGGELPGMLTPNAHLMPQPLLAVGLMTAPTSVLITILISQCMAWARRAWPRLSLTQLILVGLGVGALLDIALELGFIFTGMYAYASVIEALSLWPGTHHQFPLYEPVLFGMACQGLIGVLRYFRDDHGAAPVQRGADRWSSPFMRGAVKILSLAAAVQLSYWAYNYAISISALYADAFPADIPSYLLNGMCGPGAGYACPAPDQPLVFNTAPPDPALQGP